MTRIQAVREENTKRCSHYRRVSVTKVTDEDDDDDDDDDDEENGGRAREQ